MDKVEFPMIQISNVTIEDKKGERSIKEDYGMYGYLELKPETME